MNDYLLRIKIQNGRLAACMREAGIKNAIELARAAKIEPTQLSLLLNMKKPALKSGKSGRCGWRKDALKLADFFGVLPEDLFNERQQTEGISINTGQVSISEHQAMRLASRLAAPLLEHNAVDDSDDVTRWDIQRVMRKVMETANLTPRERRILEMRFTQDMTLDEIGKCLDVNRERINQIIAKAFRKLRHPSMSDMLRSALEESIG